MKSIVFNFKNIEKVEKFTGTKLESYFNIGTPSATFLFPKKEGEYRQKELKIKEGDVLYKDRSGVLFFKVGDIDA